jgi:hypothetical protein
MSVLSFADLEFIYKIDQHRKQADVTTKQAQESMPILQERGLIDENGYLTKKGSKAWASIGDVFERMIKGIPIEERIRSDSKSAVQANSGTMGWVFGEYLKQTYCTNSDIILVGKPLKTMRAAQGLSDTRKAAANILTSNLAVGKTLDFVEMHPYAFQYCKETGTQFIWMETRSKKQGVPVIRQAIQAKYYDYIKERFPKSSFWINYKKEEQYPPIQVRVTNRGWRNVVALIMPLDHTGMEIPVLES